MFSFEGDFKTRPKVSLGGASRKVRNGALLCPRLCLMVCFVPRLSCCLVLSLFLTPGHHKREQLWLRFNTGGKNPPLLMGFFLISLVLCCGPFFFLPPLNQATHPLPGLYCRKDCGKRGNSSLARPPCKQSGLLWLVAPLEQFVSRWRREGLGDLLSFVSKANGLRGPPSLEGWASSLTPLETDANCWGRLHSREWGLLGHRFSIPVNLSCAGWVAVNCLLYRTIESPSVYWWKRNETIYLDLADWTR